MIVNRSDEVPRLKWPRRFPVPRNLGVAAHSRIAEGKSWPAPEGATRIATVRIYRFDPDGMAGPRLDRVGVDLDDCGPVLLDALTWIRNRIGPALTFVVMAAIQPACFAGAISGIASVLRVALMP